MTTTALLLRLLAAAATTAVAASASVDGALYLPGSGLVADVDGRSYESFAREHSYILLAFYAPWCGHCKKLAPELEAAAELLKAHEPHVAIAKCDAQAEKALAESMEVRGFPTIKWIVAGEALSYTGGRTADTIVKWVTRRTGEPAERLASEAAAEAFLSKAPAVVIGAFHGESPAEVAAARLAFERASMRLEEIPFGVLDDAAVASAFADGALDPGPSVAVFKQFDERVARFEPAEAADGARAWSDAALAEHIRVQAMPLVVPFSDETASMIFGSGIDAQLLIFADDGDALLVEAARAAKAWKGAVVFVSVSRSEVRVLSFFGVEPDEYPTARLVDNSGGALARYRPDVVDGLETKEHIESWLRLWDEGALAPDLKSEDPPKGGAWSEETGITTVVGTTFDELVLTKEKDVLVLFYAPWCGHCKRLSPTWEELGMRFHGVESVTIASFDATLNEHERVHVAGFPTIMFSPAGGEGGPDTYPLLDYTGDRRPEDFVEFVKLNSKVPLSDEEWAFVENFRWEGQRNGPEEEL
jgi:protein disulfide-isomerase A1